MTDSHHFSLSISQDLQESTEIEVDEVDNLLSYSPNYAEQSFCPQFGANAHVEEVKVDELENALSCSQNYTEQACCSELGANAHVEDNIVDYSGLELPSKNVSESCSVDGSLGISEKKVVGGLLAGAMKKFAVPRSSSFHGVTKLKWSGKFEAHLWDNTSHVEGRKRKGKHVYLGSYDNEEKAARAHDVAALKYWGPGSVKLNFPVSDYDKELEMMQTMSQDEFVAHVRRKSSCFSRGSSIYRGVTRRKDGKWQARIGRVGDLKDAKDIYLGTFNSEEEAAAAFDIAAIELRGVHAVTNFDISNYSDGGVKQIGDSFQV